MYAIGIDLGTTNSAAAVYRLGRKESISIDGRKYLPSVVSFRPDQPVLVGQAAKNRLLVDPASTVSSAKRFMGNRRHVYQIGNATYSPIDIGALVLKRVVEAARQALNQDVWDAVITVPAYFDEDQKADTRRAGEQAGLNVLRLLPEPTAAAISYGLNRSRHQTILVYDLGGGTFDVSILQVQGNDFRVLGIGGDARLGGDDFDDLIVSWAARHFQQRYGIDLLEGKSREQLQARARLKEIAELAKKELTDADTAEIMLPDLLGKSLELELSIATFEEMSLPLLQKTINSTKQALQDAKLSVNDIDRVILVGGSTRMRAVRRLVTETIKEPYGDENPDEAVASGAAVVAASLFAPGENNAPAIVVKDATAHSLGVELIDAESEKPIVEHLIARNTNYPCKAGTMGSTRAPMQKQVLIKVYRGENHDPKDCHFLGELRIKVKRPTAEQIPVVAVFELDGDGLLHFRVVDVPVDTWTHPGVRQFLEYAMEHEGAVDVAQLDSLVASGTLPLPEEITIKPWTEER